MKKTTLTTIILGIAAMAYAGVGPEIQFKDKTIDFGTITGGEIGNCTFTFTNTGDETLVINKVQPSCACTSAGVWTQKVEPGKTGTIPMRFDSSHFNGAVSKAIIIQCNARSNAVLSIILKGTVYRELNASPQTATLMIYPNSSNAVSRIKIANIGTNYVALFNPTVSNLRGNSYVLKLATNTPGKDYTLTVSVKLPIVTPIDYGNITIQTSRSNKPPVTIPLVLNRIPWFSIYPSPISIPKNYTNQFLGLITVINNAPYPVTLSNPSFTDPNVQVTLASATPGHYYTLKVAIPPNYKSTKPMAVTVQTSNTNEPSIQIPFLRN
jgi:hypothetical protein